MSQAGWAERLGITPQAMSKRLRTMPLREALAESREQREKLWHRNLRRAKRGAQLSNE